MAELVAEVLALHNTLHTDRAQTDTLRTERDRLIQCQDAMNKRCKQLEEEADRLQQILATRNLELRQELGVQPMYNKCLTELAGRPYHSTFLLFAWPTDADSVLQKPTGSLKKCLPSQSTRLLRYTSSSSTVRPVKPTWQAC